MLVFNATFKHVIRIISYMYVAYIESTRGLKKYNSYEKYNSLRVLFSLSSALNLG